MNGITGSDGILSNVSISAFGQLFKLDNMIAYNFIFFNRVIFYPKDDCRENSCLFLKYI